MSIQILLTACFGGVALYAFAQHSRIRIIARGLILLNLTAIFFVWNPGLTSTIAVFLGIGRGTDLVMYFLFVLLVFQLLVLHLKLQNQLVLITQLARRSAIAGARFPGEVERVKARDDLPLP